MTQLPEKVLLDVPFFANDGDGNQCMQAAMRIALNYYKLPDRSLVELDALTGRGPGQQTWSSQIVPVLSDEGLAVHYYSKLAQEPFLGGEAYIRSHYGSDADAILALTDVPVLVRSVQRLLTSGLFTRSVMPSKTWREALAAKHLVLLTVDMRAFDDRAGPYHGHFVVLTGYDKENFFYHEVGPRDPAPNKPLDAKVLERAWNSHGTDNDVIIVSGVRKVRA